MPSCRVALAAALVELPLRDAGCLLPAWEDLMALSTSAGARNIRLHFDGARIWEAQPFYDRPLAEIAGLADSIYVSFYKGLGGLAGACLAGPADFIDEARRWRKRMGGTIFRMTPEAVGALVGLRDRLPLMAECVTWARALAAALPSYGVTAHPEVPPTNTFELYAAGEVGAVNDRLIALMTEHRLALTNPWRATDAPGRICSNSPSATGRSASIRRRSPPGSANWSALADLARCPGLPGSDGVQRAFSAQG